MITHHIENAILERKSIWGKHKITMLFNCQQAKDRQHTRAILECSVVIYLAINEWGWVGWKELCRSRRTLSTRDIFCVFLHLSRAVLVRNSATSSSDSRERHFLVHSWIIASRPRVEESLIDGLFPMRPRFQSNVPSINLVSKEMYHRIDGILLASSKYGKHQLAFAPVRKGRIFWMNDKSGGCSSKSVISSRSLLK